MSNHVQEIQGSEFTGLPHKRNYRAAPGGCLKCRNKDLIILFYEETPITLLCKRCYARTHKKYMLREYNEWNLSFIQDRGDNPHRKDVIHA